MAKKRQANKLKNQQDRENAKAQATPNKDKNDNEDRVTQHIAKGKASHPSQVKNSKNGLRIARTPKDYTF